jgi:NADH-quinone oxidoreductase subunit A
MPAPSRSPAFTENVFHERDVAAFFGLGGFCLRVDLILRVRRKRLLWKRGRGWPPLDSCVRISGDTGMPTQYIPIFIFAALAAAFPALSLILFKFIRPTPVATGAKLKPYECGVDPEGDTRGRYSVRFYIVAILFVIFDVETTFLFPWAVLFSTREPGFRLPEIYALASMFVFLGILIIGYVWLYRKGALEWV